MTIYSPGLFPPEQSAGYFPPAPAPSQSFLQRLTNPNFLQALSGFASGNTVGDQFANVNNIMAGQLQKTQATAADAAVRNKTVAMLQTADPELANAVAAGAMTPSDALNAHIKKQQEAAAANKPSFQTFDDGSYGWVHPDTGKVDIVGTAAKPKTPHFQSVGNVLFNTDTQQWVKPPDDMVSDKTLTNDQRDLIAAGLKPGTPEFQQALLNLHKLGAKPGQASPKLTEDQSKNVGFLIRAKNAETILSDPTTSSEGLSNWNQVAGALPLGIGNHMINDNAQKYNQAKLNFITAALRKESGAAISQSEYDNAAKTYFPQPGDGPDVIEQKRQAREDVIEGFKVSAGPGADAAQQTPDSNVMMNPNVTNPANQQSTPSVDDLVKKYGG